MTLAIPLSEISTALEGVLPSSLSTVGVDGMPNITYISVVSRLDDEHVVLSRQFFKKTEDNAGANPHAQVQVVEPDTGRAFLLDLVYDCTETSGPVFEKMKAKLDAVAAHEGMARVFILRGVDICRVVATEMVPCDFPTRTADRRDGAIEKVQAISQEVAAQDDLDGILQTALHGLHELLGYPHVFVMLVDEAGERLYTVASAGYAAPGTGSEVEVGEGIIGIAAQRRQTIRLTHLSGERQYLQAAHQSGRLAPIERVIQLPSIDSVESQMVVPLMAQRRLAGVIVAQGHEQAAFQAADEWVVGILASQVALSMQLLSTTDRAALPEFPSRAPVTSARGNVLQVKHYSEDNTVFLDNEYLIKGVAGSILWRLLRAYNDDGRSEFSNKEIRLDPTLALPDIKDNLEARLILLRKRLDERGQAVRIEKLSRGRFKLIVTKPLQLVSVRAAGPS